MKRDPITEYLKMLAKLTTGGAHVLAGALLSHATTVKGSKLPAGYKRGTPKQCYRNASLLVFDDPSLTYFEGYAIQEKIGFPLEHAWVADKTGRVIDTTWDAPEQNIYRGLAVPTPLLRKTVVRTGLYCALTPNEMVNVPLIEELTGKKIEKKMRHLATPS